MNNWKQWARLLRRDAHALYLAARDPRVPWYAKAVALAVAAYALSPIDLIPDFVPVLGYLDDLVIVPPPPPRAPARGAGLPPRRSSSCGSWARPCCSGCSGRGLPRCSERAAA